MNSLAAIPIDARRRRFRGEIVESRVASADPHQLVAILFDELVARLHELVRLLEAGDARAASIGARALAILAGLAATLDHARGGAIAADLAAIYDYAARRVAEALRADDAGKAAEAARIIGEIAGAWEEIGR